MERSMAELSLEKVQTKLFLQLTSDLAWASF